MGRKNRRKTLYQQEQRKNMWLVRILRLAQSSIRWEGLPDELDLVYLEMCLARNGSAIIVYDDITENYLCGQNASVGNLDLYGYPLNRSVIFRNGLQMWATPENSVIIYNNPMRTGDLWLYEQIADDMANIDMAIKVNVNSQKTTPIIPTKFTNLLTAENIYQQIDENMPYILIDPEGLDVVAFKEALTFDNRKSFTSDQLIAVQRELWNRCLTMIGINNENVLKRERVNIAEANSNLDEIAIMRRDRLNAREEACKKMEEVFGLTVNASYYSDLRVSQEGDGNGGVYNGIAHDFGTAIS